MRGVHFCCLERVDNGVRKHRTVGRQGAYGDHEKWMATKKRSLYPSGSSQYSSGTEELHPMHVRPFAVDVLINTLLRTTTSAAADICVCVPTNVVQTMCLPPIHASPDVDFVQRPVEDELLDDVVERGKLSHHRLRDAVVAILVPGNTNETIHFLRLSLA